MRYWAHDPVVSPCRQSNVQAACYIATYTQLFVPENINFERLHIYTVKRSKKEENNADLYN